VATGTWKSREMGLAGEKFNGIHHALNYIVDYHLSKFNYRGLFHKPSGNKRMTVIGGGLTAVDACMIASEMGVKRISLIYRRTKKEAPAGPLEIEKLEKSGIEFRELVQPVEFIGNGRVKAVKAIRMRLGDLDSTGRPEPIPIDNSEHLIPADIVLVAVGLAPTLPNPEKFVIEAEKDGVIKTDESFKTNIEKVFAAGDVKHGPTRIGLAFQSGIKVAKYIHEYLLKLT
jgi:glutamate synthase (NADPH/NADH) small chain